MKEGRTGGREEGRKKGRKEKKKGSEGSKGRKEVKEGNLKHFERFSISVPGIGGCTLC